MAGQHYRELKGWQRSMDLVSEVYALTKSFPSDEVFGLTSQLRRSAVSVPANIAEGQGRLHRGDFLHHLSMARGSLSETETHLQIASRLGYVQDEAVAAIWALCQEVGRLLNGLIRSLGTERAPSHRQPETDN
jgi:four helix bundle protein